MSIVAGLPYFLILLKSAGSWKLISKVALNAEVIFIFRFYNFLIVSTDESVLKKLSINQSIKAEGDKVGLIQAFLTSNFSEVTESTGITGILVYLK